MSLLCRSVDASTRSFRGDFRMLAVFVGGRGVVVMGESGVEFVGPFYRLSIIHPSYRRVGVWVRWVEGEGRRKARFGVSRRSLARLNGGYSGRKERKPASPAPGMAE